MTRYLDLSQSLSPRTPRSSDHPEVKFTAIRWFSRNGLRARTIEASLHAGTHLDTASLFYSDGETVDQVQIERLIGNALFVDCRLKEWGIIDSDFLEKRAPKLTKDDILVLCTGWHHYYLDEEKYELRAPGLDKSGVDWIAQKHPKAYCVDSPSSEHVFMRINQWKGLRPDVFGDVNPDVKRFPPAYAHKKLLPLGIIMVEGLGGSIDELIGRTAKVFVLPAKYEGVEGAPVRAIAELED